MSSRGEEDRTELALADTSLFIAVEQDRPLSGTPPESVSVSVITIGELRLGVLAADGGSVRARRLETLSAAEERHCGEGHGAAEAPGLTDPSEVTIGSVS